MNDLLQRHFTRRGFGVEFEMEADWVRRHLRDRSGSIVEIGCGIGALLRTLDAPGAIGLDHNARGLACTRGRFVSSSLVCATVASPPPSAESSDAVAARCLIEHLAAWLARTRGRSVSAPLVCASADLLPFSAESLDVIAAQHLIEHLSACETACVGWFRTLKPGGVLLLLTPNRLFCDLSVFDDDTHVELFDHKRLAGILVRAGFEIMDMRSLGLPWFRKYHDIPSGWRLRRAVTRYAESLSRLRPWRWKGQTLVCMARRPAS